MQACTLDLIAKAHLCPFTLAHGPYSVFCAIYFSTPLLCCRPKPFAPDKSSVDAFGEDATTVVVWCAYGLNVLAQSLALGIIITSIFMRQLLCNTLPSMISKLVFLLDTNILCNLAMACTWLLTCLVYLVVLGGFLSAPTYGFLSFLIIPVLCDHPLYSPEHCSQPYAYAPTLTLRTLG